MLLRSVKVPEYDNFPKPRDDLESAISDLWDSLEMDSGDIAVKFHRVAVGLWCRVQPFHQNANVECPVYRFLALSSLTANGAFLHAKDVTPAVAKLQYWARSIIYMEMLNRFEEHADDQAAAER